MNTRALEESGYSPDMELVAGSVGVDENGELNGLVFEPDAMAYAWKNYHDFPEDQMKELSLIHISGKILDAYEGAGAAL